MLKKMKKENAILCKQAGGSMVTGMLPLLFLILFGAIFILLMLDCYQCIKTKQSVDAGLAGYLDIMETAQCMEDDTKRSIENYLHDEFGVNKESIDFTGSTESIAASGSVILSVKCNMPTHTINRILPDSFTYKFVSERVITGSIY